MNHEEIISRVQEPEAVTLGESSPFDMDPWTARKQAAALAAGKRLTGHTARLRREQGLSPVQARKVLESAVGRVLDAI